MTTLLFLSMSLNVVLSCVALRQRRSIRELREEQALLRVEQSELRARADCLRNLLGSS